MRVRAEREPRLAAAPAPSVARTLAAAVGNRAFSEYVARRRTVARDDVAAAASEPRRVQTEYGDFDVFPDELEGKLPVAQPGAGQVWPMRAGAFARLQASMAGILAKTWPVTITSEPRSPVAQGFRPAVLLDLAWLQTQPVGAELIAAIAKTGKSLAITETLGDNTSRPEKEGVASNATIRYNPASWSPVPLLRAGLPLDNGVEPEEWMRRPPAIGLAHELIHAWRFMTGTRADGEHEEQAIGLGEFSDEAFTENRFREAFGLTARPRVE